MSDQMPDEVWVEVGIALRVHICDPVSYDPRPDVPSLRYIRGDLYDSKPCPHVVGETTQHCALAQSYVERAEQAEAERDRLRAALAAITAYDPDWSGDPLFAYHIEGLQRIAKGALDHD